MSRAVDATESGIMKKTKYLLISTDAIKSISASEALHLLTASSRSRYKNRHLQLNKCFRERMAAFIGILFLSGLSFKVDAYPVAEDLWVLTISSEDDAEAGTPSATMSGSVPLTSRHRASGRDRNHIPPLHIQTLYNSYLLARRNRASPVLLALPGGS